MPSNKPIIEAVIKLLEYHQESLRSIIKTAIVVGEMEIGKGKEILDYIAELNSDILKMIDNIDIKSDLNSEVRQLAILNKIKGLALINNDGSGIRELSVFFPDVSDRTLRYDLHKMCLEGLIVKIGNRGPNTVYKPVL